MITRINAEIASKAIIEALGFSSDEHAITDKGVLAAALRRAVTIHPAVSRTTLISNVAEPLFHITSDKYPNQVGLRQRLRAILEDLTTIGDILEIVDIDESRLIPQRTLYYPGFPSFVRRANGDILLLGALPGCNSPVPLEVQVHVVHQRLLRVIPASCDASILRRIKEFGLKEIAGTNWTDCPPREVPESYLDRFNRDLSSRNPEGILNPAAILAGGDVTNYRGRWRSVRQDDNGKFIGRIPQAYGSPAWAYLEIERGQVLRSRFFPTPGSRFRAFEEAWRLQSAIDKVGGNPQQIRIKKINQIETVINIYSPIPSWLERRWILLADKANEPGSLASYTFSDTEVDEEIEFAKNMFWLELNDTQRTED